jgi:predicted NBD/HSP70 family sugar kinase
MLSDFAGTQIALETFETPLEPEALIAQLATRIERILRTYGDGANCEGVGIAVPGMVDQKTGTILNAPQLGWRGVRIREALAKATGLPVQVENAPIACALSKMWLGQREGDTGDFVYVTVSEGVGAGVVVNGQVMRGHSHTAGEFGHVPINPDGPRCLCGARGCWEAHTSNLATISRYLGRELEASETRALLAETPLTVSDLIMRARTGDEAARAALLETGRYLGLGLSMIVNTVNPGRIFIGGEVTAAWDLIGPVVTAEIQSRALTAASAATPVIPEQADTYPRLRGACALIAAPLFAAPTVG